jgi:hypothetical protein
VRVRLYLRDLNVDGVHGDHERDERVRDVLLTVEDLACLIWGRFL